MKHIHSILLLVLALSASVVLTGCDDTPDRENYYTAKGDMANAYLLKRPELFSKFVDIINKSRMVNLDCWAPAAPCQPPLSAADYWRLYMLPIRSLLGTGCQISSVMFP